MCEREGVRCGGFQLDKHTKFRFLHTNLWSLDSTPPAYLARSAGVVGVAGDRPPDRQQRAGGQPAHVCVSTAKRHVCLSNIALAAGEEI